MAEDTPAAAPEAAAKSPKKKAATQPKKEAQRQSLQLMVINIVSKDRKGTSMPNIKKCLKAEGVDVVKDNKRINNTVKKLVDQGTLIQTKGVGASGSFKLAKTDTTAKKTPTDTKKTGTTKTTFKKTTVNIVGAKKSSKRGIDKTVALKRKTSRKAPATTQKAAAAKTSSPKKKTASEKAKPAKKSTAKKNAAKKSAPKKGRKQ